MDKINDYAYGRYTLIEAFRRVMDDSVKLSEKAVMNFSAKLYRLDGKITLERAQTLGDIVVSMDASQKSAFDALAVKKRRGKLA